MGGRNDEYSAVSVNANGNLAHMMGGGVGRGLGKFYNVEQEGWVTFYREFGEGQISEHWCILISQPLCNYRRLP